MTIENSRSTLRISVKMLRQVAGVQYVCLRLTTIHMQWLLEAKCVSRRWKLRIGVELAQLLRWPRKVEFDRYLGQHHIRSGFFVNRAKVATCEDGSGQ